MNDWNIHWEDAGQNQNNGAGVQRLAFITHEALEALIKDVTTVPAKRYMLRHLRAAFFAYDNVFLFFIRL